MTEKVLPMFRAEFLPAGAVVTTESVATHAPQEIMLDNAYGLTIYDPSLQPDEVQKRYAALSLRRVATVACWAAGADREATQLILGGDAAEERPEPTVRQRLHHALAAAPYVQQYFDVGLLRGRVVDGGNDALMFSYSQERLLLSLAKGINPQDARTLSVLREFDERFYETEPSLLSVLTKYLAMKQLLPKDPAIVHPNTESGSYIATMALSSGPSELSVAAPSQVPEAQASDEAPGKALPPNHVLAGLDLSKLARRPGPAENQRKNDHKVFVGKLARYGIPVDPETGHRRIAWKSAALTFALPNCLSEPCKTAAALYICGVTYEEMQPLIDSGEAPYTLVKQARRQLRVPEGADLTLYAIHEGYVGFDMRTQPCPDVMPPANILLMRTMLEEGHDYKTLSSKVPRLPLVEAMKYNMEQFGVASLRELTLAAATHGMVIFKPTKPSLGPRTTRSRMPSRLAAATEQPGAKSSLALDRLFAKNLSEHVNVQSGTGDITISWKNAEFAFNFTADLPAHLGLVAVLQCFGISQDEIKLSGLKVPWISNAQWKVRKYFDISHYDRTGTLRKVVEGGYLRNVDTSEYTPVEPNLNAREYSVLNALYRYSRRDVPKNTALTEVQVRNNIMYMYTLFGIAASSSRLLIAGALEGKLPALAKHFAGSS